MRDSTPHIPVLFEDNHLLVAVKPANMLSQADDTGDMDLLTWLKEDLKRRHAKPGNVFLGLVHRLDRPVGGVMVFAKTSKAASRLSDQVRTRLMRKTYRAVVRGNPGEGGELRHFLLKDGRTNTVRVAEPGTPGAKEAVLRYRTVAGGRTCSLVEIDLLTGRPHQIRVQLAAAGAPLYGDQKYGPAADGRPGEAIALWAVALRFEHPTRKEAMTFESAPPAVHPWTLWAPSGSERA